MKVWPIFYNYSEYILCTNKYVLMETYISRNTIYLPCTKYSVFVYQHHNSKLQIKTGWDFCTMTILLFIFKRANVSDSANRRNESSKEMMRKISVRKINTQSQVFGVAHLHSHGRAKIANLNSLICNRYFSTLYVFN